MQPSPFQSITSEGGPEATLVHHDKVAPGGAPGSDLKSRLQAQVSGHEDALKGYMGRLNNDETLHPDEYSDYEQRLKEHSHDSMLLQRLNKQHGEIERHGKKLKSETPESSTRVEGEELYNEYSGGRK